jgi:hypothetical protein
VMTATLPSSLPIWFLPVLNDVDFYISGLREQRKPCFVA